MATGFGNWFEGLPMGTSSRADSAARILVTGGSGFIGTNLVDFYLAAGATEIVNLDHRAPKDPRHSGLWRDVDLRDERSVRRSMSDFEPTAVFHLGARTDLRGQGEEDYSANTDGVRHVIEGVRGLPPGTRTIFASSRLVCRIDHEPRSETDYCPTTLYGESKVAGERIVRSHAGSDLEWLIVRPTSIWGPWFGVPYRNFFEAIERGVYLHPTDRPVPKSYGFVGNTVYQLDRLMFGAFESAVRRTFYLADYPPLELREWATLIAEALGRRLRSAPHMVLKGAARIGDLAERLTKIEAPLTSFRLDNLLTPMVYDTAPLEKRVGALPYSLSAGVGATTTWLSQTSGRKIAGE